MKSIAVLLIVLASGAARAQSYTVFSFDAPAGMTLVRVEGINASGQILGVYQDSAQTFHFLLRSANGATFTEISVPGASQINATGLNNNGQTTGYYMDATGAHSFIRGADGSITTFDIPPEGGIATQPPLPTAINDKGDLAGTAFSESSVAWGFMLSADRKTYTSIQFPGATTTQVSGIDNSGEVVGRFRFGGSFGLWHGFLRKADGTYRIIDAPGAVLETSVTGINNRGQMVANGMALNPDGTSAGPDPAVGTATAIDDNGRLVGCSTTTPCKGFLAVPTVGTQPVIRPARGVISASAFGGFETIAPGTWIEIYGSILSQTTRQWQASDFVGGVAPISLDGVSVTINGRPAVVDYVSPGQVNAFTPATLSPGPAQVTVTNSAGTSRGYAVTVAATEPGLLAVSQDVASTWAVGVFPDFQTFVLPPLTYPTVPPMAPVPSRPAKAGETIVLWGVGFGSATPQFLFGGVPAQVSYAGPAPGTLGLYQFNVVVPTGLLQQGAQLQVQVNGQATEQTKLYVAVTP
jgi:uncharacterized protein (TIGR03437 family)